MAKAKDGGESFGLTGQSTGSVVEKIREKLPQSREVSKERKEATKNRSRNLKTHQSCPSEPLKHTRPSKPIRRSSVEFPTAKPRNSVEIASATASLSSGEFAASRYKHVPAGHSEVSLASSVRIGDVLRMK